MSKNYAETLAYWYLRLNGFFPLQDFVLHWPRTQRRRAIQPPTQTGDAIAEQPAELQDTLVARPQQRSGDADADIIAVRFPYVYEPVGGAAKTDWDEVFRTAAPAGFDFQHKVVGLIVQVKNTPSRTPSQIRDVTQDVSNAFTEWRVKYAIERMGMFERGPGDEWDTTRVEVELRNKRLVHVPDTNYCVGKLVISRDELQNPAWVNLTLSSATAFIKDRLHDRVYGSYKRSSWTHFPDDLIQYLAMEQIG